MKIYLTERDIKRMIKEAIVKEAPGMPLMNLAGRRESTNVEDRRGQVPDFASMIRFNGQKMSFLQIYVAFVGQDDAYTTLGTDKGVISAIQSINAAYQKARQLMGKFTQRAAIQVRNGVNKVRSAFNESTIGQIGEVDVVGTMKKLIQLNSDLFTQMVDNYIANVQAGKMNPNAAFSQIKKTYEMMMSYIPINIPANG